MGRQPCCDKVGLKKGQWTAEEDKKLINFILTNGQCCWRSVPKLAGLLRCGKSCRLRWTNYLRPDLKRGLLSEHEEQMVIDLHAQLGNRWSKIASHLPATTDNEIKNHWNTHIKKKLRKMGIDPVTHKPLSEEEASQQTKKKPHDKKPPRDQELKTDRDDQGFNIDGVPLISPNVILDVPCSNSYGPSSSCTSSGDDSSKFLEDMEFLDQFLDFKWVMSEDSADTVDNNNKNNNVVREQSIVDDMDLSSLDLLMNDDFVGISECPRSWSHGLL